MVTIQNGVQLEIERTEQEDTALLVFLMAKVAKNQVLSNALNWPGILVSESTASSIMYLLRDYINLLSNH